MCCVQHFVAHATMSGGDIFSFLLPSCWRHNRCLAKAYSRVACWWRHQDLCYTFPRHCRRRHDIALPTILGALWDAPYSRRHACCAVHFASKNTAATYEGNNISYSCGQGVINCTRHQQFCLVLDRERLQQQDCTRPDHKIVVQRALQ